jgi:hypothetical protein
MWVKGYMVAQSSNEVKKKLQAEAEKIKSRVHTHFLLFQFQAKRNCTKERKKRLGLSLFKFTFVSLTITLFPLALTPLLHCIVHAPSNWNLELENALHDLLVLQITNHSISACS